MKYKINCEITVDVTLTREQVSTLLRFLGETAPGYEDDRWKAADALLRDFKAIGELMDQETVEISF